MKYLLSIAVILLINNAAFAQYGYYSPNAGMNNIGYGLQSILSTNYASTAQQGYSNGQADLINAQGNFLVNQSIANINNEMAYSMALQNQIQRTKTFFEKRQINRYYRDLEDYQKQERIRLKASGAYDMEAIQNIYRLPN